MSNINFRPAQEYQSGESRTIPRLGNVTHVAFKVPEAARHDPVLLEAFAEHVITSTVDEFNIQPRSFFTTVLLGGENTDSAWGKSQSRMVRDSYGTQRQRTLEDFSMNAMIELGTSSGSNGDGYCTDIILQFADPVSAGGANKRMKLQGGAAGSKSVISIFDHFNENNCGAMALGMLSAYYDKERSESELKMDSLKELRAYVKRERNCPHSKAIRLWTKLVNTKEALKRDSATANARRGLANGLIATCGLTPGEPMTHADLRKCIPVLEGLRGGAKCAIRVFDQDRGYSLVFESCNNPDERGEIAYWFDLQQGTIAGALHYSPITKLPKVLGGQRKFCSLCNKTCKTLDEHRCDKRCFICQHENVHATRGKRFEPTHCRSCGRNFAGQECFDQHITSGACKVKWRCQTCKKGFMYPKERADNKPDSNLKACSPAAHKCGNIRCANCHEWAGDNHQCFMARKDWVTRKHRKDGTAYPTIYCDFESTQNEERVSNDGRVEGDLHRVNYICTVLADGTQDGIQLESHYGKDCLTKWVKMIFENKEYEGANIMFHNGRGYDFPLLITELMRPEHKLRIKPTMNGWKITTFKAFRTKKAGKVSSYTFRDSLNWLSMPLSDFTSAFDLVTVKGFFPHHFNTAENMSYVGPVPGLEYFMLESVPPYMVKKIQEWHKEQVEKNYVWNQLEEIEKYCSADVRLLMQGCEVFRKLVRDLSAYTLRSHEASEDSKEADEMSEDILEKTGMDCFGYTTLPSTAMAFIRGSILKNGTVAALPNSIVRELTTHQTGGRTDCHFLYRKARKGERMYYVDKTSLYPSICKYGKFPIGHPVVVVFDSAGGWEDARSRAVNAESISTIDLEAVKSLRDPASWVGKRLLTRLGFTPPQELTPMERMREILQRTGCSLVKVDVTPPQGLRDPLLHEKKDGKLIFDLTPKTGAIYYSWELEKAIQLGYTITKVHKVWWWKESTTGILKEYVDIFLKIKQQAGDWPDWVKNEEDQEKYIGEYFEREGIKLDKARIEKNPALYKIAKLFLNSAWGKFSQRLYYDDAEILFDTDEGVLTFNKIRANGSLQDFHILNEHTLLCRTSRAPEDNSAGQGVSDARQVATNRNIAIAMAVTSQARLCLYNDFIEPLNRGRERVLYMDTDSTIFVVYPGEEPADFIKLGEFLGEATNEVGAKYEWGMTIDEMISGGPKNYGYKLSNGKTTLKVKGISTGRSDIAAVLTYERMKACIINGALNLSGEKTLRLEHTGLRRCPTSRLDIVTQKLHKNYRLAYTKREVLPPIYDEDGVLIEIPTRPWTIETQGKYREMIEALKKKPGGAPPKRKLESPEDPKREPKKIKGEALFVGTPYEAFKVTNGLKKRKREPINVSL
jgi:hypothetical protein